MSIICSADYSLRIIPQSCRIGWINKLEKRLIKNYPMKLRLGVVGVEEAMRTPWIPSLSDSPAVFVPARGEIGGLPISDTVQRLQFVQQIKDVYSSFSDEDL